MLNLFFLLALLLPISTEAETTSNVLSTILVGSKDQALAVLQESFDSEFSNGSRTNLVDRVGFKDSFHSFWTAESEVEAALTPLVDGDALEPTAYLVEFSYRTKYLDGKQHIASLISQIKTVAAKHGDITVAESSKSYRTLPEQTARCFSTFVNDPDLKILKENMALDKVDNQTFQMLANDAIPTEEERKAIYLYAVKREGCLKPMVSLITFWPNHPVVPLYTSLGDSVDQLILSLYKGQLSYGNFAKIRKSYNAKFEEARLKVTAEMKAQDSAAIDRAQHLAVEQQKLFIEQQKTYADLYKPQSLPVPTPMPRSKTTTCNFYGNQMVCNTF